MRRRLAAQRPPNAQDSLDVAISLQDLGAVYSEAGDTAPAVHLLEEGACVCE